MGKGIRESDFDWYVIGRVREYEGEQRANLLRLIGIGSFYAVELINRYGLNLGFVEFPSVVDEPFHQAVTVLAVSWTMLALGVMVCLRNRVFPASLKFISTGCDIVILTSILTVADGPQSPLIVGYFLLIALSTLRFNLLLVRFATTGAIGGYLFLCGFARWFTDREIRVERYHQLIVLLALALTGIVLGQMIRKIHGMARDYRQRDQENPA